LRLIDSKAPSAAVGFKTWLRHIAENAAEASAEGGFMGFGVTLVSAKEKATPSEPANVSGARGLPSPHG